MSNKIEADLRASWICPEETDARILGGPNVPKPLQGQGHQPRTILSPTVWDSMRKRGYYKANYKCQICGADCSKPGSMDFHELYTIDYEAGTSTFKRGIAICKTCHSFYHSGRLITLHKQGIPFYGKKQVLGTVEHGFKLINEWNKAHPDEPKLKAFATFLDYLKVDDLASEMEELIKKYDIEFWYSDSKSFAEWGDWKLVMGNKEYPTRYKDYHDWEEAMEEMSKNDYERSASNPFTGGVFDEINKILKEENE